MQDDPGFIAARQLLCVVDGAGRLSAFGTGARELLGWKTARLGTLLQDVVHPHDAPRLMLTLSHSAVDGQEHVLDLRMRGQSGSWVPARCQLSPLEGQEQARYAVAIRLVADEEQEEAARERASRLESHLWRIALEVHSAGGGDRASLREAWWAVPEVSELTERQSDILLRVVRGQRIASIADELTVAESTIRNHLSKIYVTFGVHSQAALLSRLLQRSE
jgi:DNA-binding CsgD family transcriptional regulator